MGVLSRLANWYVARSNSQNPSQWFTDWIRGGANSSSGVVVSQLRAMRDVTWMAGISIRSSDLAKCPLHVYRKTPDGGQEIYSGHAVERLLQQPNGWQNKLEFVELMQATFLNKGNSVAAIQRNGRAQPVGLIPIECWEVRSGPTGELYYYWTTNNIHQEAILRGFPNPIPAADIFHLRWISFDGLCGLSRLSLARDAIGLSIALEEYSATLFANGARPGGVLETDKKLSDPQFERFKRQWSENYTGIENTGKTPILEEGLKWKPQTMTSVESQTIEARRLQIEQIATALDIPQHRLGIKAEGGSQEIIASHQMYLNNTISSDAERWESKLNQIFGFDGINTFVEFDLDYFNRADLKTRMEAYRIGIAGTVFKVNEVRQKEGYGRVPAGDVLLQPANVVPLGTVPTAPSAPGPGSDTTGEPAPGGDGDPAALKPVD